MFSSGNAGRTLHNLQQLPQQQRLEARVQEPTLVRAMQSAILDLDVIPATGKKSGRKMK